MNSKFNLVFSTRFIIVSVFILIFVVSFNKIQAQDTSKVHYLSIKKIGKEWKVVDANDNNKTKVKAKKGERISWKAEGTEVYFQFMDDKLFKKYNEKSKSGKPMVLKINGNAEKKTYAYAVFCLEDSSFATGDSPPKIIVD